LAIEPSYDNYLLLRINMYINKIHGILFFRKGLWYKNTLCSILTDFRDQLDWSMRITENKNGNIEAITLSDIIYLLKYKFNKNHIDFLKIDIEGAEKELFISGAIQDHLKDIRMLVMEIHEEFIKKDYINQIMCDNNFFTCENGETSIYINSI
jgi:FkbM family methyltransferase